MTSAAPLLAAPALKAAAQAVTTPASLWNAYAAADAKAVAAREQWHLMRQAGGTDGTAGFLYGKYYEAQHAAEAAWEAWAKAQNAAYGRRG